MSKLKQFKTNVKFVDADIVLPMRTYAKRRKPVMLKRCMDIIGAIIGIVLMSPAFLLIYLCITREDSGPAIFTQERVGYRGKSFTLYKFRSMKVKAEINGLPILCKTNDNRLTHVGRFLRSHHLDELPQLWNVLKGDMSFVGYRPERKFFIDRIMAVNPQYERLYSMRPGLFSNATLYNGYTDTMEKMVERLRMDLEYMQTWSLGSDLKIILKTALSILTGKIF